ncbi:GNAT family N-acetyltransferase [Luteolibacter flavescens]|uniref:GNAT family N-acetyltransferase n=1 Tax=Luteolibacter flavescens TaxID=1859460 RepID=A0ABT3FVZ7_9BACT|nr:GNAT family N-acetyltransferase [Luteolibacter flavescens]MCW1887155.1 GNAT family N-acetyltransferase [Luteolibacter flavescens]
MNFRNVTTADLTDCARFFSDVFNAEPWNENWSVGSSHQRLSDCALTPNFLGMVGEDDTGIAALALGYWQRYQEEKHYYLLEFCVANERQGEGIGTLLMEALHARLQEEGVNRIYTLTARDTPAQDFYGKAGFYVSPKMILMARRY